ncbi:MAG: tRNA (adenosine(37)-N6)-threonylcarbamoyltransferase complex ATPase subunit type 1 TsaE [Anaerolineae bacterium]|jgi:tRNA threonylcarbamoyladenosine biosynthesis protein TsaE|nr:tRNA (adenosine(37)-N6)-threonylcarbamoyltransferase complex ATPase subunit type 1 TsaE [Anaerolineae bacterium]MBT7783826.1 tRNA (adenosine(37)-N6)-threonylcarbamoyltransferase complex ATPase subunit type 1 TsaE [Anaerolineae bacterium]
MPILDENALDFISRSPEQSRRMGMRLGAMLKLGDILCLQGDLGAGKTTFVQGLAQGWGSLDPVSSPTFIIVNLYRRADQSQLFHLDTYRLESASEAEMLDLDEMLATGSLVIEWPERIENILPKERLWLNLEYIDEERRRLQFSATSEYYQDMINQLRKSAFGVA